MFRFLIWLGFYVGILSHVLLRAMRSGPDISFYLWWDEHWRELVGLLILDGAFLVVWEHSPHILGQFMEHLLPVTYGTAPIMGFFVDRKLNHSQLLKEIRSQLARLNRPSQPHRPFLLF